MNKTAIKRILLEQKEEISKINSAYFISREIEKKAKRALRDKLIKVIIGIRRCGKSVLAHRILLRKSYGYVNFDDERLIGATANDLNNFLEVLEEINPSFNHLLLDEIQNIEGWELFVNRLKRSGYNIVITGSNSKLLSQELASHLTGRHICLELYPFSFREFLQRKKFFYTEQLLYLTATRAKIKRLLHEYLDQGGMPELFEVGNQEQYLRDLFDKITTRDIAARRGIKYVKDIKELSLYLLSNFSSKVTYNKLRSLFKIGSTHTVKNYIDYLEEAYLLFQLYPFSFKLKEQFSGAKKIYSIDTGIIKSLSYQFSPNIGRIMENAVFLELKRRGLDFYFYTDGIGHEVDFVIKKGPRVSQLVQVCFDLENLEAKKREIGSIIKASFKLNCRQLLIITWEEEGEEKHRGRKIILQPLWQWLLNIKQ